MFEYAYQYHYQHTYDSTSIYLLHSTYKHLFTIRIRFAYMSLPVDDVTGIDLTEKKKCAEEVKALYERPVTEDLYFCFLCSCSGHMPVIFRCNFYPSELPTVVLYNLSYCTKNMAIRGRAKRKDRVPVYLILQIVLCYSNVCKCHEAEIRLVDGYSSCSGRVEIYHNGKWGTVCDDDWDDTDARVVCHQLGFDVGATAFSYAYFGQGAGPIWLDNVECNGNESLISSCRRNGWGYHNCNHREDAGVICDGDVRLVGGSTPNEGRVEIYHDKQWGTVCDNEWNECNSQIVCHQLGHYHDAKPHLSAKFGEGDGTVWLDYVDCSRENDMLAKCNHAGWAVNNCSHSKDAGVHCEVPLAGIRLSGGSDLFEGRVEVYHEGKWGTVCDDYWDDTDAGVVCRQLGYSMTGIAVLQAAFGRRPSTRSRMWLDDVYCRGNESSLFDCDHSGWGVSDCSSIEEAGVICKNDTSSCSLRPCLNGGSCIEQSYEYFCICLDGYEGENCEIASPCATEPCLNGGYCITENGGYVCMCKDGFAGQNCQTDTSPCSLRPCLNGGSCIEQSYGYICVCLDGYVGENCTNASPCATEPCLNGGYCITENGGYVCMCKDGFAGQNCQTDLQKSASASLMASDLQEPVSGSWMAVVVIANIVLFALFVIITSVFLTCIQKRSSYQFSNENDQLVIETSLDDSSTYSIGKDDKVQEVQQVEL